MKTPNFNRRKGVKEDVCGFALLTALKGFRTGVCAQTGDGSAKPEI
jgi:hypothetical protein